MWVYDLDFNLLKEKKVRKNKLSLVIKATFEWRTSGHIELTKIKLKIQNFTSVFYSPKNVPM